MTSNGLTRDEVKEYLIQADMMLQVWAVHCMDVEDAMGGFDGDAYCTPLERIFHNMALDCGLDYQKDIGKEAYKRLKEEEE